MTMPLNSSSCTAVTSFLSVRGHYSNKNGAKRLKFSICQRRSEITVLPTIGRNLHASPDGPKTYACRLWAASLYADAAVRLSYHHPLLRTIARRIRDGIRGAVQKRET